MFRLFTVCWFFYFYFFTYYTEKKRGSFTISTSKHFGCFNFHGYFEQYIVLPKVRMGRDWNEPLPLLLNKKNTSDQVKSSLHNEVQCYTCFLIQDLCNTTCYPNVITLTPDVYTYCHLSLLPNTNMTGKGSMQNPYILIWLSYLAHWWHHSRREDTRGHRCHAGWPLCHWRHSHGRKMRWYTWWSHLIGR